MSSQKIDRSRRGFLSAALFSREGREQIREKRVRSGLIPPNLQQSISANRCLQCQGFCEKSCPQQIIKRHPQDHDLQGQPYLDFNDNGCTFCMDCNAACPGLAGQDLEPQQHRLGTASLSQQACYAWNNMICKSCINACADRLISFDANGKPGIKRDDCNGCGFCLKTCPAGAIEIVT